jgi:hypothetical protein
MATYIVFTRESTRNAAELETYSQNVGPTLAGHPANGYRLFKQSDLDKFLKKAAKPIKPT